MSAKIGVNVRMTEAAYAELVNEAAGEGCSLSDYVTRRLTADRNDGTDAGEALLTCSCGSQWFGLREGIGADGGKFAGAVALNASGSVAAYSALIACFECGTFIEVPAPPPPRPSLQLVPR